MEKFATRSLAAFVWLVFALGGSGCGGRKDAAVEGAGGEEPEAIVPIVAQPKIDTAPSDEWATEELAERIKASLKALLHGDSGGRFATGFALAPLRPAKLDLEFFETGGLRVWRGVSSEVADAGEDQFAGALRDLYANYLDAQPEQDALKVFRIAVAGGVATSKVRFESSGAGREGGRVQQRAVWACAWQLGGNGLPLLKSLRVEDFEEVVSPGDSWFVASEAAVLGANPSWDAQLRHGLDDWLQRIEMFHGSFLGQRSGITVGDIDPDGFDEIFAGAGPSAVFGPSGRGFDWDTVQVSPLPGLDFQAFASGGYGLEVGAGDLDGDGLDDLLVARGAGPAAAARVRAFSYLGTVAGLSGADATPFPSLYGARVDGGDLVGRSRQVLAIGAGPDPTADTTLQVLEYDGSGLPVLLSVETFPGSTFGVNAAIADLGY